jgi:integrase
VNTHRSEVSPSFLTQLPKIQQVELYLERKAKAPSTIETYTKALKELAKRTNLDNTIKTELAIARYTTKNGTPATNRWKRQLVSAYKHFCKLHKILWEEPPTYEIDEKTIQPPSNEKIKMLIASAKTRTALMINISAQTGLRPIEVTGHPKGLKTKDFHPDTNTITPTSAKGCNARPPIKITAELATRLQTYTIKKNLKPNDLLFKSTTKSYASSFSKVKNRLADKTGDQTFKTIRLYDLRHAYITNLLRKTQNAEIVSQKVGHKRLNTTQKYIHLTTDETGEYIVESTTDQKRADKLLEQGFNYCLTTPDGYMKFRKPK